MNELRIATAGVARSDSDPSALPSVDPSARHAARQGSGGRPLAIVDVLLKSPATLVVELARGEPVISRLSLVVLATMFLCGLATATFSGGLQLLVVPFKLAFGMFFSALLCLPSLHVLSCLGGSRQTVRQTWGAMLMGVALMGVLLVGFAPVVWVFSYATTSPEFVGVVHLVAFVVSVAFGLRLVRRVLASIEPGSARVMTIWSAMFVIVLLQMATTLRPLVGPFEGWALGDRMFFVAHWLSSVL